MRKGKRGETGFPPLSLAKTNDCILQAELCTEPESTIENSPINPRHKASETSPSPLSSFVLDDLLQSSSNHCQCGSESYVSGASFSGSTYIIGCEDGRVEEKERSVIGKKGK